MPTDERYYGTIEVVRVRSQRARRSRDGYSCMRVCAWLCLLLLILLALIIAAILYFLPWIGGSGRRQKPDFSKQDFAVGFDLSAGYGTSAVSFPNGSTVDLSQIHGSIEYNQMMANLSLDSSQHPTPPYYGQGYHSDLPRQIRRKMRKAIGLPASNDVAAMASVLQQLKIAAERELGTFQYVFVTVPHLPALYNEDLLDACSYIGLQLLTLPWYVFRSGDQAQWPVTHVNTAMAGNGLGLCEDFKNATHCAEQRHCPENDDTLSVLYTGEALTAHVSPICNSMHFYAAGGIANFSLGYNAELTLPSGTYWERVRAALREAMDSYYSHGHELGLVVAHGDGLLHKSPFMILLKDEVKQSQVNHKLPKFSANDPLFAAARGAAEFGKRCMLTDLDCMPDLTPKPPGW